ncbi:hypothetical protein ACJW30_11G027700 [Castanea mollissima]
MSKYLIKNGEDISVPSLLCTLLRLLTFYLPILISPWLILFFYLSNLALLENGFRMKRKTMQDTLQTEIKASFHREILAIPKELNQIQTQIIIKNNWALHIIKDKGTTSKNIIKIIPIWLNVAMETCKVHNRGLQISFCL